MLKEKVANDYDETATNVARRGGTKSFSFKFRLLSLLTSAGALAFVSEGNLIVVGSGVGGIYAALFAAKALAKKEESANDN